MDYFYKYSPERNNYTLQHMKKYLNLTGEFYELNIFLNAKGKIQVNSIVPELNVGKGSWKYISIIQWQLFLFLIKIIHLKDGMKI